MEGFILMHGIANKDDIVKIASKHCGDIIDIREDGSINVVDKDAENVSKLKVINISEDDLIGILYNNLRLFAKFDRNTYKMAFYRKTTKVLVFLTKFKFIGWTKAKSPIIQFKGSEYKGWSKIEEYFLIDKNRSKEFRKIVLKQIGNKAGYNTLKDVKIIGTGKTKFGKSYPIIEIEGGKTTTLSYLAKKYPNMHYSEVKKAIGYDAWLEEHTEKEEVKARDFRQNCIQYYNDFQIQAIRKNSKSFILRYCYCKETRVIDHDMTKREILDRTPWRITNFDEFVKFAASVGESEFTAEQFDHSAHYYTYNDFLSDLKTRLMKEAQGKEDIEPIGRKYFDSVKGP